MASSFGKLCHASSRPEGSSWLRRLTGRIIPPVLTTTSSLGKTGVIAGPAC